MDELLCSILSSEFVRDFRRCCHRILQKLPEFMAGQGFTVNLLVPSTIHLIDDSVCDLPHESKLCAGRSLAADFLLEKDHIDQLPILQYRTCSL